MYPGNLLPSPPVDVAIDDGLPSYLLRRGCHALAGGRHRESPRGAERAGEGVPALMLKLSSLGSCRSTTELRH